MQATSAYHSSLNHFTMSTSANAEYTATADIPAIVNELRETFYSGKTKDVAWRKDQLKRITYMIKDNETRLCGEL